MFKVSLPTGVRGHAFGYERTFPRLDFRRISLIAQQVSAVFCVGSDWIVRVAHQTAPVARRHHFLQQSFRLHACNTGQAVANCWRKNPNNTWLRCRRMRSAVDTALINEPNLDCGAQAGDRKSVV